MAAPVETVPTAWSAVERPWKLDARQAAGDVEDGDHGADQRVARAGAELVPVSRDKEHHAAGEQDCAEDEYGDALPSHHPSDVDVPLETLGIKFSLRAAGGLRLVSADACRSVRVKDAGRLPACQHRFDVRHIDWLK